MLKFSTLIYFVEVTRTCKENIFTDLSDTFSSYFQRKIWISNGNGLTMNREMRCRIADDQKWTM